MGPWISKILAKKVVFLVVPHYSVIFNPTK